MTLIPLALSLSNSFTKIGAIVAFAGVLGVAIVALLLFSQAREIKRLREWAGRAPERAAEMEQRVSGAATARAAPQTTGVQGVKAIPRAGALPAQALAAAAPGAPAPVVAAPGAPAPVVAAAAAQPAGAAQVAAATQVPGATPMPAAAQATPAAGTPGTRPPSPTQPPAGPPGAPSPSAAPTQAPPAPRVPAAATAAAAAAAAPASEASPVAAAPVGAAASGSSTRGQGQAVAPLTPAASSNSAAVGAPAPGQQAAGIPRANHLAAEAELAAGAPAAAAGRPQRSATAAVPAAAANSAAPSRVAVGASAAAVRAGAGASAGAQTAPVRARSAFPPAPSEGNARRRPEEAAPARAGGATAERSQGIRAASRREQLGRDAKRAARPRRLGLILAGPVVIAAVVLAAVVLSGKSGGSSHSKTSPPAAHAVHLGSITVSVLNATEKEGLAHHVASELRGRGYARATALDGRPAGETSTTVVEYSPGDRAAAERVARAISGAGVKPLEGAVAPLAAGAQVVVIVGANTAATVP